MPVRFKQKCMKCRKNYVTVSRGQRYPLCYECQKDGLKGSIKDPKMKELFNIPEEFYKNNSFLRDIKINYLKYKKLSEKQIQAFKKAVKEIKEASTSS